MSNLESHDPALEALLSYLAEAHHFNFAGYKRSSLARRIQKRMQEVSCQRYSDYNEYLRLVPEEFSRLFDTIEINHTCFFRDPENWEYLAQVLVPQILAHKSPEEPIRVWSVGCAAGQETYSLAIVLAEVMGIEQFRQRVRIYGTDVDQAALQQAKQATYRAEELTDELSHLPSKRLMQFFRRSNNHYTFRAELLDCIAFRHHNAILQPPFPRIDLLVCRNTLIYFNLEGQTKALVRFYFSLKESGFLFLGNAEIILPHASFFTPVSVQHHVFAKAAKNQVSVALLSKGLLKRDWKPKDNSNFPSKNNY